MANWAEACSVCIIYNKERMKKRELHVEGKCVPKAEKKMLLKSKSVSVIKKKKVMIIDFSGCECCS
jgi:hypothetical protein